MSQPQQNIPVVRIDANQLAVRLCCSKQSIWLRYKAGTFPVPHYLGVKRVWFLSEIEEWELQQMAKRKAEKESEALPGTPRRETRLNPEQQGNGEIPQDA